MNEIKEMCVYVCDDFCANGARCSVNSETNKPQCECLANFFGERCERKSEFMYIAGGIGATVLFIIIMVLLIWMICVRTNTNKNSFSKKISIHTLPPSGMCNLINFYY